MHYPSHKAAQLRLRCPTWKQDSAKIRLRLSQLSGHLPEFAEPFFQVMCCCCSCAAPKKHTTDPPHGAWGTDT